MALNTEENNKPYAMKCLNKRKLGKVFVGKHRTALENIRQEIAIMKKLVLKVIFVKIYIESRKRSEISRSLG